MPRRHIFAWHGSYGLADVTIVRRYSEKNNNDKDANVILRFTSKVLSDKTRPEYILLELGKQLE